MTSRIVSAKSVRNGIKIKFSDFHEKIFHRWWLADNCDLSTRLEGNSQKHTNAPDRVVETYVFSYFHNFLNKRILSHSLSLCAMYSH